MNDLKPVKISGELFWNKWMAEFNKAFNEGNDRYECTIGNISDDDVVKLTGLGIRVKHKDSMGNFIVAKSKYLFKPRDAEGNLVAVDTLGNGSKCEAVVAAYKHKLSAKHGNAPTILHSQKDDKTYLIVTEVKTYIPDAKQEDDDTL
jgi:hypothetical protein